MEKEILIKITDDNAYEDDEEFYIDLSDPQGEDRDMASPHAASHCHSVPTHLSFRFPCE